MISGVLLQTIFDLRISLSCSLNKCNCDTKVQYTYKHMNVLGTSPHMSPLDWFIIWQILKSSICNIPHMRATWLNLLRADVILQIFPFWQSGIPNPSCRWAAQVPRERGGISCTIAWQSSPPIGDRTFPGRRHVTFAIASSGVTSIQKPDSRLTLFSNLTWD